MRRLFVQYSSCRVIIIVLIAVLQHYYSAPTIIKSADNHTNHYVI